MILVRERLWVLESSHCMIFKRGWSPFPKEIVKQGPRWFSLFQQEMEPRDFLFQNLIVKETTVGRASGCGFVHVPSVGGGWINQRGLQAFSRALKRETTISLIAKITWDDETPSPPSLTVLVSGTQSSKMWPNIYSIVKRWTAIPKSGDIK